MGARQWYRQLYILTSTMNFDCYCYSYSNSYEYKILEGPHEYEVYSLHSQPTNKLAPFYNFSSCRLTHRPTS